MAPDAPPMPMGKFGPVLDAVIVDPCARHYVHSSEPEKVEEPPNLRCNRATRRAVRFGRKVTLR